jgi:hypothetical protein
MRKGSKRPIVSVDPLVTNLLHVFNPNGRPVAFLVPASMAEEARLLLQEGELPDEEM